MYIIGSVLRKFSSLELSTADEKVYTLKTNFLSKLALRFIGIPHLGFRGRARVILKEAIKISGRETRILDAGCGFGIYSMTLSERGVGKIDAIDVDPKRTQTLENMFKEEPDFAGYINLHTGSLTTLPFKNETYDLIICSEVIEHIADHLSAAKELARVLKNGGVLILSVPFDSKFQQKTYKRFGHERPGYTKDSLAKILGPLNIEITKDFYHEYSFGTILFNVYNSMKSKVLMGLLFYPFYALYLLDSRLKIGEPNGIVIVAKKI